jgi:hypothetical protein
MNNNPAGLSKLAKKPSFWFLLIQFLVVVLLFGLFMARTDDINTKNQNNQRRFLQSTSDSQVVVQNHESKTVDCAVAMSDIRFNKCPPIVVEGFENENPWYVPSSDYSNGVDQRIFPLVPADYPVRGEKADILRTETMADGVVLPGDFDLRNATAEVYASKLDRPVYPAGYPTAPYWHQLRRVVNFQLARREGKDPSTLNRWPDLWANYTLDEIAGLVMGEYPASLQQELVGKLFKEGISLNHDVVRFRSVVDIVSKQFRFSCLNTWSVDAVAPVTFLLKWEKGVPRPEEMAWMISTGKITTEDGVPQDLVDSIQSMDLAHAADFTAYPTGSPMHPSWPAMHASGSSLSYWLPVVAEITPEQYCEALRLDYGVAFARTVAGVHYEMDNIAGLNLATLIIKEKMPAMMASNYGCDADSVRTKLDHLAFDWKHFNPYDCTILGTPVGDRLMYGTA